VHLPIWACGDLAVGIAPAASGRGGIRERVGMQAVVCEARGPSVRAHRSGILTGPCGPGPDPGRNSGPTGPSPRPSRVSRLGLGRAVRVPG
jgi:hypothetical protein